MERTFSLPDNADTVAVLGAAERNLKQIRQSLGVGITARGRTVKVEGMPVSVNDAVQVLSELSDAALRQRPLNHDEVAEMLLRVSIGPAGPDSLEVYSRQSRIAPKTGGQRRYLEAIANNDMVFCAGPAGTGKTYLAVASAVSMLKKGKVRRLVLARPAVEAGEKLGFLPGDIAQKVNPYLRPLLDAVEDMMPFEQVQRFMTADVIEVIPLAFMRGRTLNDAVIILDEAQNTTIGQMLMFLTRMGHGSKVIVTGDTSQIDLEPGVESGMIDAARRLIRVPGIEFVTLDRTDIVRHSLVQRVVEAYGKAEGTSR